MNLQRVRRYRDHEVRVCCSECGRMVIEIRAVADLDAKPGTFYCVLCAEAKQEGRAQPMD